eukprot:TRINITY_DN29008_c0_g1_i2.p1 TRINITY_DN29008_c0_g1~~TRINITY_DN29008_c0_g1_i2.p1  ORF type:complete len:270 (+),score=87.10 TRINITY_DN29008_c0_g1_i2:140-949(+)
MPAQQSAAAADATAASTAVPAEAMQIDSAAAGLKRSKESSSASGSSDKKKQRDEVAVEQLTDTMAKLLLSTTRTVATLQGALMDVVVFSKEEQLGADIMERTKAAVRDYGETVSKMQPEEKGAHFAPHIFIWLELFAVVKAFCHLKAVSEVKPFVRIYEKMEEFNQTLAKTRALYVEELGLSSEQALRMAVADEIRSCRVSKCFNPQQMKVEIATGSPLARTVVHGLITAICLGAKGMRKQGPPPKGDSERKLVRILEKKNGGKQRKDS